MKRAAKMLIELTGSGAEVTATVIEGGKRVRSVRASREVMASALEFLPRALEIIAAHGRPPEPPLRLVKATQ
jgi:hypothetical protein